jgi:predicted  nucleic acid-binding Zn-ribbon protein
MDIYGYMKRAFEETVGSETRAPRGEIQRLDGRITGVENKVALLQAKIAAGDANVSSLRTEMLLMKHELLAEVRRLDARIDGVDRELRTAIAVRERIAALEARQRA